MINSIPTAQPSDAWVGIVLLIVYITICIWLSKISYDAENKIKDDK